MNMSSSDDDFINPPNNPAGEETSKRTRDEDNEQITKGMKMKKVGVLNIFNFFVYSMMDNLIYLYYFCHWRRL